MVLRSSIHDRDEDELTKLQVAPKLAARKSVSEARLLEREEDSAAERARGTLTRRGAFVGRQDVLRTLQTAFAEAIDAYARRCEPDTLRDDPGFGAAPIARVIPAVRERLPDVPEPVALQPGQPVNWKHLQ